VGPPRMRCRFVEAISQVVEILSETVSERLLRKAQDCVAAFIQELRQSGVAEDAFVQALMEDAAGQAQEAVSRADWYRKWGSHFMPSVIFAHKMQQCNNFKDPGVQGYGGKLFREILEAADNKFNSLPPPKPSARRATASAPRILTMSTFNDRYGG